ncbi:hypothetical protein [Marinomonas posidonica]|uniref:Lipoprotein n=1 Tax=Marinomonas posidonica (strain CECT 7376 / NCIMB 14433 / IVIA-Po-181) TaxID=491952 RepID=F6CYH6_MARPP|nr:hypothetical protein [Marinomonas posidonica]AEF54585.1 hypothetical protein Mar181_1543 [Marinomonas posidonica IVIA-Po-181]
MRNAFLLAVIGAAMISGCSTTNQKTNAKVEKTKNMTSEQLVGEWGCLTTYSNLDLRTFDSINIKSDGFFTDLSDTYYPIMDDPEHTLFSYTRYLTGSWVLADNKLSYLFLTQGKIMHKEFKNSPLWEKIKAEKQEEKVRLMDKVIYNALSKPPPQDESITLSIKMSSSDMFTYEQTYGGKTYDGFCTRK